MVLQRLKSDKIEAGEANDDDKGWENADEHRQIKDMNTGCEGGSDMQQELLLNLGLKPGSAAMDLNGV